jgi:hypothetical protein
LTHQQSLKEKDVAIRFLRSWLSSGSHIGAGLRVTVQVGGGEATERNAVTFDASCDTEQLLQACLLSVQKGRELRLSLARNEHMELTELLKKEGCL